MAPNSGAFFIRKIDPVVSFQRPSLKRLRCAIGTIKVLLSTLGFSFECI